MDPSAVSAWTRGFERPAIVGLSGLSLTLGWDLFSERRCESSEWRPKSA
jgi:hypothetical protein